MLIDFLGVFLGATVITALIWILTHWVSLVAAWVLAVMVCVAGAFLRAWLDIKYGERIRNYGKNE